MTTSQTPTPAAELLAGLPPEWPDATLRDQIRAALARSGEVVISLDDDPTGVQSGTGYKAAVPGYQISGKTGTAQRADPDLHRYKGYVTSYLGFAPYDDPAILTYVVLNNPRKGDSGSSTANPVYKDVMKFALPRYSVTPDAEPHKTKPITW